MLFPGKDTAEVGMKVSPTSEVNVKFWSWLFILEEQRAFSVCCKVQQRIEDKSIEEKKGISHGFNLCGSYAH